MIKRTCFLCGAKDNIVTQEVSRKALDRVFQWGEIRLKLEKKFLCKSCCEEFIDEEEVV